MSLNIEKTLNNATRKLFSYTNGVGRLHALTDTNYLQLRQSNSEIRLQHNHSRTQAIKSHVCAKVDKFAMTTMRSMAPVYTVTDTVFGTCRERPFATIVPTKFAHLRDQIGVVGWILYYFEPGPQNLVGMLGTASTAAGIAIGLINVGVGTEHMIAFEHALELMAWPIFRVWGQLSSLVGFVLKAVPLAGAALCGIAVGLVQGVRAKLSEPMPEDRAEPCLNNLTLNEEDLAEVSDLYYIRLSSGYAFDIRELEQFNRQRVDWVNPLTFPLQTLADEDRERIIRHRSNVGQKMLIQQTSRDGAAVRINDDILQSLQAVAAGLNHTADESNKEAVLGCLSEQRHNLSPAAAKDFDLVMTSDTGETIDSIFANLNPDRDPSSVFFGAEFSGCANGIAAYVQERVDFILRCKKAARQTV